MRVWHCVQAHDVSDLRVFEGKHHVDDYIREVGLPACFLYTGNFYENMILRGHMRYHEETDSFEFRQPVILAKTKCGFLKSFWNKLISVLQWRCYMSKKTSLPSRKPSSTGGTAARPH